MHSDLQHPPQEAVDDAKHPKDAKEHPLAPLQSVPLDGGFSPRGPRIKAESEDPALLEATDPSKKRQEPI
jgi:hypothetical protein